MKECCEVTADYRERQRRGLRVVLWINVLMFLVEAAAGLLAHSTALLADSVDMLGDAIVYGFSLYVVARGAVWQARGALLKGAIMAAFGAGVLAEVAAKVIEGVVPVAETMGAIGALALAANVVCLALLWARRADDVNMRSAWTCSLNDVAGNVGVLVAGGRRRAYRPRLA
jgi:Co/Zn/Cd efflux system component